MSTTRDCISVVIADAQPLTELGMRRLLESESDLVVIGSAQSERAAAQCAKDLRPDIIVLDSELPGLANVGIARWLASCEPATSVILLAGRQEPTHAQHALHSGVRGYVLKQSIPEVLLQAVRATIAGGVYLDPAALEQLISLRRQTVNHVDIRQQSVAHLTDREREVLRLIAFGFSHKEIAGRLGITSKSVETYKMRASDKLNLRTRAKIVQYAILQGWLLDALE